MTKSKSNYFKCRGSVIFNRQVELFTKYPDYEDTPRYRQKVFSETFLNVSPEPKDFEFRNKKYYYFIKFYKQGIISFQVGYEKDYEKPTKGEDTFESEKDKMYPNFKAFIRLEDQMIFIEDNKKFISINQSIKVLQNIFSLIITDGYKILIELVTNSFSFWEAVKKHENDKIISITFNLLAPNFLGANYKSDELIRELQLEQNVEEMQITLSSQTGIKVNKERLEDIIEYTSKGSGNWFMKIVDKIANKIKTIRKSDNPDKAKIVSFNSDEIEIKEDE